MSAFMKRFHIMVVRGSSPESLIKHHYGVYRSAYFYI